MKFTPAEAAEFLDRNRIIAALPRFGAVAVLDSLPEFGNMVCKVVIKRLKRVGMFEVTVEEA
jgi:hypothetical protein